MSFAEQLFLTDDAGVVINPATEEKQDAIALTQTDGSQLTGVVDSSGATVNPATEEKQDSIILQQTDGTQTTKVKNVAGTTVNPATEEKQDSIILQQTDGTQVAKLKNVAGTTINPATEEKQDTAIDLLSKGADWWHEVKEGNIASHLLVSKFGSATVGTTISPIATGLVYQTPIAATALEFVSSSANDTSAGSGAQEVTITGLNSSWEEVTQTIDTNGITAVALPTNLIRLYRWYVSRSGTYATQAAGSHAGVLTIRVSGAGATWSTISATPFPFGQSQIGCYTIPAGKTGYVVSKNFFSDATKSVDIYFFQRPNADDVVAPFSGSMRIVEREVGFAGGFGPQWKAGKGPYIGPCDIGFMGVVSVGSADIAVEFEILLIG